MRTSNTSLLALALFTALAGAAGLAQAQQSRQNQQTIDEGRVISSTPIIDRGRTVGYNVNYEFAGRRYTTQMAQRPDATIPVQVSPMGVTTMTAPSGAEPYEAQARQSDNAAWQNVVPEAGVVVGSGPAYPQTTYVQPVYAAPVIVAPYGYGYGYAPSYYAPAPYYAPPLYSPIGLSLNLGYSRGWGGHGGRWR